MKNALSLFLITALFGTTVLFSGGQERGSKQETHDRFIGAWRLAWLEEPDADGTVHKADCTGLLVYTRDGHMSVQVMYRNPQTGGQAGPVQSSTIWLSTGTSIEDKKNDEGPQRYSVSPRVMRFFPCTKTVRLGSTAAR